MGALPVPRFEADVNADVYNCIVANDGLVFPIELFVKISNIPNSCKPPVVEVAENVSVAVSNDIYL